MIGVEMSALSVILLALAALILAYLLRNNRYPRLNLILHFTAFVYFLLVTIMKAGEVAVLISVLSGVFALLALWRSIALAARYKRAQ